MTSIVNGQVSSSITHRYSLVALKTGAFQIPSFSVQFRGQTYTSKPISIEVVQGPLSQPQGGQRQSYQDKTQDLQDRIFLLMRLGRERAYVNEIIPVTIKLYVNNLAIRDIQYPQISQGGFSVGEFTQPKQYRESLNGILYDVIEFDTDIFALRAGNLQLGPAELKCNLLVKKQSSRQRRSPFFNNDFFGQDFFGDFFSHYETEPLTLKSIGTSTSLSANGERSRTIGIPITITALPQGNKPDGFSGAIGQYNFSLEADPEEVKVGDPITLKMTISGEGNLKTVAPPALNLSDDFKVYEPQVQEAKGSKTIEQVIIPKNEKVCEIPEISFSFFDAKSGEYKKIVKGPIAIKVRPLPKGEELKIFETSKEGEAVLRRKEILGRDIIYIKDTPGRLRKKGLYLCRNKLFVAILFLPLLAIISILIFQRRKERLQNDIGYARRLRAPAEARKNLLMIQGLLGSEEPGEFFNAVFKALQEYLGDKFHLPTAGITSNIIEKLKSRNINQEILDKIRDCFNICDIARYAPSTITKVQMLKTFKLLQEIIDRFQKTRVG